MFITIKTKIINLIFQSNSNNIENTNFFQLLTCLKEYRFFYKLDFKKNFFIKLKNIFFLKLLYFKLLYGTFLCNKKHYYKKFHKKTYLLFLNEKYEPFFNTYLSINRYYHYNNSSFSKCILGYYIGKIKKIQKFIQLFYKKNLNKIPLKISYSDTNATNNTNQNIKYEYYKKPKKCIHLIKQFTSNNCFFDKKIVKNNKIYEKINTKILKLIGDIPQSNILPPEKTLFIRKLNPLTNEEVIFFLLGFISFIYSVR
uniref:Uncharacterized protein n=1 Tax=Lotharella oceanica TaxID=641309 RepID=A0A7S2U1V7_9EUKA|mmetsp:Transcript_4224/g.8216  ORF Transcript_4224/g.8216 Transcript_4224/m.8216 type:complete len:255 (+) Transcript_4224:3220-3984(+)